MFRLNTKVALKSKSFRGWWRYTCQKLHIIFCCFFKSLNLRSSVFWQISSTIDVLHGTKLCCNYLYLMFSPSFSLNFSDGSVMPFQKLSAVSRIAFFSVRFRHLPSFVQVFIDKIPSVVPYYLRYAIFPKCIQAQLRNKKRNRRLFTVISQAEESRVWSAFTSIQ